MPSQLQRTLTHDRRLAIRAAVVDAAVWGIVTFFIAAAVLIGLRQPVGIAGIAALLSTYFSWRRPASLAAVATDLDRRHGLADLLSSAWAVRGSNEPWAASLRSMADAKAATLPPSPWPGRWTVRRSACGLAMAVAVLLAANLIPTRTTAAEPPVQFGGQTAARSTPTLEYAAERRRAANTASSETRLPGEPESAANGQAGSESAQTAANDSNGNGHADSKQASSIEFNSSAAGVTHPSGTAGGNRIATDRTGNPGATGIVQSESRELSEATTDLGRTPPNASKENRLAAPPPAGYRDLISDFFAR